MTGQFNLLTDLAVFSSWTFYTLTFMAVIRYRNMRPDVKRSYRVPGYPLTPAIAIGSRRICDCQSAVSGGDPGVPYVSGQYRRHGGRFGSV